MRRGTGAHDPNMSELNSHLDIKVLESLTSQDQGEKFASQITDITKRCLFPGPGKNLRACGDEGIRHEQKTRTRSRLKPPTSATEDGEATKSSSEAVPKSRQQEKRFHNAVPEASKDFPEKSHPDQRSYQKPRESRARHQICSAQ
ncbi:uncharacterized protein LOC9643944 [Selaginella moellendorffii]|uniref:uncharacterized protein LOC9643944 n=1 Tax=Selaginella moellendorffii TaxID=88036 RepID=UPI000D1CC20A|nr:uncharacterized protein LOC9643944 [Selaginella moellendorffii]|eukprot:XP_024544630.1 uncharacterized protein LOC9643944 [Selaginella moellendorffii]